MIELDYDKESGMILVKAIKSDFGQESFITDRNNLNLFLNKEAKYDKEDYFLHWRMPLYYFGNIVDRFQDILYTSRGGELLEIYNKKLISVYECTDSISINYLPSDNKFLTTYQREYCNTVIWKNAMLCSFDLGLGKTRASLVWAKEGLFKRLLIVAPKNLLSNWQSEIKDIYGQECLSYKGTPKRRKILFNDFIKSNLFNIIVTNYEMVGELKNLKFDSVIIDEIQNLSNPTIKIYKDIEHLLRNSNPKIQGLSGTPIRLKVRDLWAVLNLLDPLIAGGQTEFIEDYEDVLSSSKYSYEINGLTYKKKAKGRRGAKNLEKLRQKQESIIFRVKRDKYVKFSESIELINIEMTPKQRKFYEEIENEVSLEVDIKNVLHKGLQLMKAAEGLHNFKESLESGKVDYLREEIKRGIKFVHWSRFKAINFLLQDLYKDKVVVYNSDIPDGLRKLNVWAFQGVKNDDERREYERLQKFYPNFAFKPGEAQVISGTVNLRSGLGVNFHSADTTIFSSFDLNPNSNIQAKDRVARLGQTANEIYTKFLVSINTKEKEILEALMEYYQICLEVLDGKHNKDFDLSRKILDILRN